MRLRFDEFWADGHADVSWGPWATSNSKRRSRSRGGDGGPRRWRDGRRYDGLRGSTTVIGLADDSAPLDENTPVLTLTGHRPMRQ